MYVEVMYNTYILYVYVVTVFVYNIQTLLWQYVCMYVGKVKYLANLPQPELWANGNILQRRNLSHHHSSDWEAAKGDTSWD